MVCAISFTPFLSWAVSEGYDANPSMLSSTFKGFYSPIPKVIQSTSPYGGQICHTTETAQGYIAAKAKWRNPNIVGSISVGNYTYPVQKTNISGIGIIARLSGTFVYNDRPTASIVIGDTYQTITSSATSGSASVYFGNKYWALVSIPSEPLIPGSYTIDPTTTAVDVACEAIDSSNNANGAGYARGTVVIQAPTCYLGDSVSSIVNLNLGDYDWGKVKGLSVGSNFGSVSKTLTMQCQSSSWPKVTVTDKNNTANNSNIISLTDPSASTTAQGVGMQIFLNNQSQPQQLTTKFNLTSSKLTQDKTISLPIEFKYIKTSDAVTLGQANAIVDLTFTYD